VRAEVDLARAHCDTLGAQESRLQLRRGARGLEPPARADDTVPGQVVSRRLLTQDARDEARVARQPRLQRHATVRRHAPAGNRVDRGQDSLAAVVSGGALHERYVTLGGMRCPRQIVVFLVAFGLVLLVPVGAQVAPPKPVAAGEVADASRHAALQAAMEAALRAEFDAQGLVGLAAAVVRDGTVAHELYFGHADRAADIPVDARTMFRWASISKPVTAVAALQLVLAEKLDLDRDVRTYVPEFPLKPWPITARQLLCHQSGVVHYLNGKVVRTQATYDREHPFEDTVLALDQFKESDLVAEPGTTFAYTTHGYMLLGAVVQRAGGERFADQVQRRIAEPAGMTTFQPDYQWVDIPHRAVGYRRLGEASVPTTNTDVSWKLPGGGYVSNVGDLARFAAALMGDTLLPAETREKMWTNQATRDGKRGGYGLGFGVSTVEGERRVAHSGSQEKTRTLMQLFPKERVAVVLMTNSEWAKLDPVATALWAQVR